MKKILIVAVIAIIVGFAVNTFSDKTDALSWPKKDLKSLPGLSVKQTELLFKAIAWEESRHKPKAYNKYEDANGLMQIRPCVISDVNKIILRAPVFVHKDAFDVEASKHIFYYYLSHWGKHAKKRWGKKYSMELYARLWNGGPRWFSKPPRIKKRSKGYWLRVQKWMRTKPWKK